MIGTHLTRAQLKDTRIMLPIAELTPWESNPRAIEKHNFERLRDRVSGTQIKPLLVLHHPDPNLNGIVLGGNMRVRAYKELGRDKVWVSIVEFEKQGDRFYPYINGEQDVDKQGLFRSFATIEDGMLHYALIDNEEFGHYVDQELAELIQPSQLELDMYTVHIDKPKTLLDIQEYFGEGGTDPALTEDATESVNTISDKPIKVTVTFNQMDEAQSFKKRVEDMGYVARLKQ